MFPNLSRLRRGRTSKLREPLKGCLTGVPIGFKRSTSSSRSLSSSSRRKDSSFDRPSSTLTLYLEIWRKYHQVLMHQLLITETDVALSSLGETRSHGKTNTGRKTISWPTLSGHHSQQLGPFMVFKGGYLTDLSSRLL